MPGSCISNHERLNEQWQCGRERQFSKSRHFGMDAEIQAMDGKQPDGICNPVRNVSWLDRHGCTHKT